MPEISTSQTPNVMAQELANVKAFNKMMDEKDLGTGGIHAANSSFKSQMAAGQQPQGLVFDGSAQARAQESFFQSEMQGLQQSAMGSIIDGKEIDEQFKFLTDLLIEQYKDPDPEKETDHTKNIQTMVQLMTAGEQVQSNRLMREQNALIRHNNRISTEQRIGMKVQYQDIFFEVQDGQESTPFFYRLGRDAANGKITIRDNQGVIMRELTLQSLKKGDHQIDWDLTMANGQKAPKGTYFIDFEARDKDKKRVENIVELEGVISDIDSGEDGYPEYYVAGIKIDGKISKVSKNTTASDQISKYMREIKDAAVTGIQAPAPLLPKAEVILESNPISPPVAKLPLEEGGLEDAFHEVAREVNTELFSQQQLIDVNA